MAALSVLTDKIHQLSMYEQLMKSIGLSQKELQVYLASLEFGPMTVQGLAQRTHVHRTTVYLQISSLAKRGLMSKTEKDGRTYFTAEPPEAVERLFEKKLEMTRTAQAQFKKILPRLKTLAETASIKPQVRFFEDKEGIESIQRDIIKSRAGSMDEFISIDPDNLLFPMRPGDHRERIARRYGKIRVIYTSKKGAFLPQKEGPRERRFIPADQFAFEGELVIYGGKVALVTPGKKKIGVIIEHRSIADLLRSIFNLAWEEAGRLKPS